MPMPMPAGVARQKVTMYAMKEMSRVSLVANSRPTQKVMTNLWQAMAGKQISRYDQNVFVVLACH